MSLYFYSIISTIIFSFSAFDCVPVFRNLLQINNFKSFSNPKFSSTPRSRFSLIKPIPLYTTSQKTPTLIAIDDDPTFQFNTDMKSTNSRMLIDYLNEHGVFIRSNEPFILPFKNFYYPHLLSSDNYVKQLTYYLYYQNYLLPHSSIDIDDFRF